MTASYDTVIRMSGNNTGIEVPPEVLTELGAGKRPRVRVRVNDYRFVTTVGAMNGVAMLSFAKAHREASGLEGGQTVRVELELDTAAVEVTVPPALATALAAAGLTDAFDRLAPSRRKEYARQVTEAKAETTRDRRVAKIVAELS